MITYVPSGTKNLLPIFPTLEWDRMEEYYLEILSSEDVVATSNKYILDICKEIDLRIHFVTSLGEIDAVNLKNISQIHESKSDSYQKPSAIPFSRTDHSIMRNNIIANTTFTGYKTILETDTRYFEELFNTPLAWIEWEDEYLPIIIIDTKFTEFKLDDRYMYELSIDFKYSKEKSIIR